MSSKPMIEALLGDLKDSPEVLRLVADDVDDAGWKSWIESLPDSALTLSKPVANRSKTEITGELSGSFPISGAKGSFTPKSVRLSNETFEISGEIEISDQNIPVGGKVGSAGQLPLSLIEGSDHNLKISELLDWFGFEDGQSDFAAAAMTKPAGKLTLLSFQLDGSEQVASVELNSSLPKFLQPALVGKLSAHFQGAHDAKFAAQQLQVAVLFEVKIGKHPVAASLQPQGSGVWRFALDASQNSPSIADATNLLGSNDLSDAVSELHLDSLVIQGLEVHFDLSNGKALTTAVTAGFQLGSWLLNGRVSYPPVGLQAWLPDSRSINLRTILESQIGPAPWAPQIAVDSFAIGSVPAQKQFHLAAGLSADWSLNLSDIAMPAVGADLSFQRTASGNSATLGFRFSFAGTNFDATGETSSDAEGWQFNGKMSGQPLSLPAWLKSVSTALHAPNIPAPDLTIEALSMSFNSGSKDLKFDGESSLQTDFEILGKASPLLEAKVVVDSTHDEEGTRTLSGKLIGQIEIANVGFAVTYQFGEKRVLSGVWRLEDDPEQSLSAHEIPSEFLGKIASKIPDDLELAGAAFEYDFDEKRLNLVAETKTGSKAFFVFTPPKIQPDTSTKVLKTATNNPLISDELAASAAAGAADSAAAKHGFIFGIELNIGGNGEANDASLMKLKGIQSGFDGAKNFFGSDHSGGSNSVSFVALISTVRYDRFVVPSLPPLPLGKSDDSAAAVPVSSGSMNVTEGVSLALDIHFEPPVKAHTEMDRIAQIVGESDLVVVASANKSKLSMIAVLETHLQIPAPGGGALEVTKAGISFVVDLKTPTNSRFDAFGEMKILLNSRTISTSVILEVSPTDLQLAADASGDPDILSGPPGLAGLHLKDVGFVVGVEFEPLGLDFGLQAGFYIQGDGLKPGLQTPKDAGKFAYILDITEAAEIPIPDPLLIAFSVDEIALNDAVVAVTGKTPKASFPNNPEIVDAIDEISKAIKLSDVSAYFAEKTVMLPDGSTADPGFGFTAAISILNSWQAFARLNVNEGSGITGMAMMSAIELGDILKISGDGPGFRKSSPDNQNISSYSSYVDGEPAKTPATTADSWLVPPGGPYFEISTVASSKKFIALSCDIELFDAVGAGLTLEVSKEKVVFDTTLNVDDHLALELKGDLTLEGSGEESSQSFSFVGDADFEFDLKGDVGPVEGSVNLPVIGDVHIDLGTLHLDTRFDAKIHLELSKSDFDLKIEGDFEFDGLSLSIPPLELSKDEVFSSLKDLGELILDHIEREAETVFHDLILAAARRVAEAAMKVAEVAEKAAEDIEKAGAWAADETAKATEDIANVEQAAEKEAQVLAQQTTRAAKEAKQIAKQGLQTVKDIGSDAVAAVASIENEAAQTVQTLENETAEIADEAATFVSDTANDIKDVAEEAERKIADIAADAEADFEKVVGPAEDALKEATEKANAFLKEADKWKDKTKKLLDKIGDDLKSAGHKVGSFISSHTPW